MGGEYGGLAAISAPINCNSAWPIAVEARGGFVGGGDGFVMTLNVSSGITVPLLANKSGKLRHR
jgi:hypothetical protein